MRRSTRIIELCAAAVLVTSSGCVNGSRSDKPKPNDEPPSLGSAEPIIVQRREKDGETSMKIQDFTEKNNTLSPWGDAGGGHAP